MVPNQVPRSLEPPRTGARALRVNRSRNPEPLPFLARLRPRLLLSAMFTGIVQGIASVQALADQLGLRSFIAAGLAAWSASVAVDGVCLTVTALQGGDSEAARFDVMQQSLGPDHPGHPAARQPRQRGARRARRRRDRRPSAVGPCRFHGPGGAGAPARKQPCAAHRGAGAVDALCLRQGLYRRQRRQPHRFGGAARSGRGRLVRGLADPRDGCAPPPSPRRPRVRR